MLSKDSLPNQALILQFRPKTCRKEQYKRELVAFISQKLMVDDSLITEAVKKIQENY
jgi:hypothetical protein